jgi:hypothetical protein
VSVLLTAKTGGSEMACDGYCNNPDCKNPQCEGRLSRIRPERKRSQQTSTLYFTNSHHEVVEFTLQSGYEPEDGEADTVQERQYSVPPGRTVEIEVHPEDGEEMVDVDILTLGVGFAHYLPDRQGVITLQHLRPGEEWAFEFVYVG